MEELKIVNPEDFRFKVTRTWQGVTGFTLSGKEGTLAEAYCLTFPTVMTRPTNKGTISFTNGKITFQHPGASLKDVRGITRATSEGGIFSADIEPDAAATLSGILERKNGYAHAKVGVKLDNTLGSGFTLYHLS